MNRGEVEERDKKENGERRWGALLYSLFGFGDKVASIIDTKYLSSWELGRPKMVLCWAMSLLNYSGRH